MSSNPDSRHTSPGDKTAPGDDEFAEASLNPVSSSSAGIGDAAVHVRGNGRGNLLGNGRSTERRCGWARLVT
ncbi:hypothetical protein QMG61_04315 [Cryobacterium sp. PH31-AA6]|uniref:hypothetical protein n=1 Tax=Cryobacterium sp. PH31-AA6 TaxID=3046205 RepID=UPI0024B9ADCA|nr:hypothetical protein [Cryobacterium sp. PH31-AA6]MDJ0322987.1 hypothetical protein [Cryobacterium sp. PH31-AA6]